MVVVLVLAGVAVLGAVVVLAMGRGGGLAEVHPDYPPLPLSDPRRVTGPEVAFLRLPRATWGYQVAVTDEALHYLAHALTERDARVVALQQQVDDLRERLGEPAEPQQVGALHGIQEPVAVNGSPTGPPLPSPGPGAAEGGEDEPGRATGEQHP
ncbi:hypothetical protein [Actinomadura roseirufa]|uniref:hypothetical protein n=1 Tax=Actinomadura roseirufa TaxID=2094049 RepID=UPI001041849B|nr:hypothetical protein [Actinomadura roseirufa]